MSAVRIGFIGAGKMATALARGIVSQGQILSRPQDLMASCPPQGKKNIAKILATGCGSKISPFLGSQFSAAETMTTELQFSMK